MKLLQRVQAVMCRLPYEGGRMAEVGVWLGMMSEQLLRRRPDLTLIMVDRWREVPPGHRYRESASLIAQHNDVQMEMAFQEALSRTAFADGRRIVMRGESIEMAEQVEDGSLDLGFLDDDHSRDGVLEGLEAWLRKIRVGGWIGGHDWKHPRHTEVEPAVLDFRMSHGIRNPLVMGADHTWFWRVR